MQQRRFFWLITAISFLYFSPLNSISVSADTLPVATSTSSTLVPTNPTPRSPSANSYLTLDLLPRRGLGWMQCTFDSQRYCYEKVTKIDPSGSETDSDMTLSTLCHNNDLSSTELCTLDGLDWMELAVNPKNGALSASDVQTVYHWKIRTGKFSPDIMMLGDTQRAKVTGSSTDGWVLEVWAKPALKAYLNGCFTAASCPDTSVASTYSYNISGYVRMLGIEPDIKKIQWPSVDTESLRSALRGTYISTNGMSQSWKFSSDTFFVTAVSPHFLPPDASGKSEVTPGYVKVFLPESYITLDRGYKDLSMVTADRVKLSVSGANATAKVTKVDGGILVDTGVEHFSAPNPEMMVLKATDAAVAPVTTTLSPSTVPTLATPVVLSTLKKGASKLLSTIAKTSASQKAKWSASGVCKIVGGKVVALKKTGTCKVTVSVLNSKKKYAVLKTQSFKVS